MFWISVTIFSLTAGVLGFSFWYSFFVLGSTIVFAKHNEQSTLRHISIRTFVLIYSIGALLAFFVDIVYGRLLLDLWHYPHLEGIWSIVFPVFIYYPLGGLSTYTLYELIQSTLNHSRKHSMPKKKIVAICLIIMGITGILLPIILHGSAFQQYAGVLMMVMTAPLLDGCMYLLYGRSLFFDMLERPGTLLGFVLTWVTAVVLHELPNVRAQEWIYQNLPLQSTFLGVPIEIAIFGWFFLTLVSVTFVELMVKIIEKS